MNYKIPNKPVLSFRSSVGDTLQLPTQQLVAALNMAHGLVDEIAQFRVNIFDILGMRNLSAFVGELFAASLITFTNDLFIKNPHQDGYPDLLLMDPKGRALYETLKNAGRLQDKAPFSPFGNGGIEVKATCGSLPTPAQFKKANIDRKPHLGDQRIGYMRGYDWKAHHRETNNLIGILWDFIGGVPRIVAVFFCPTLTENDWGEIVQPKAGGGRTTSVSIMNRDGVRKMYEHWIAVYDDDPRYIAFLNKYNNGNAIGA